MVYPCAAGPESLWRAGYSSGAAFFLRPYDNDMMFEESTVLMGVALLGAARCLVMHATGTKGRLLSLSDS